MTVGVKYCGGCHVSYERKDLLRIIRKRYPEYLYEFVTDGGTYDYILTLCCCPAQCADCSAYTARKGIVWINHMLSAEEMDVLFR